MPRAKKSRDWSVWISFAALVISLWTAIDNFQDRNASRAKNENARIYSAFYLGKSVAEVSYFKWEGFRVPDGHPEKVLMSRREDLNLALVKSGLERLGLSFQIEKIDLARWAYEAGPGHTDAASIFSQLLRSHLGEKAAEAFEAGILFGALALSIEDQFPGSRVMFEGYYFVIVDSFNKFALKNEIAKLPEKYDRYDAAVAVEQIELDLRRLFLDQ